MSPSDEENALAVLKEEMKLPKPAAPISMNMTFQTPELECPAHLFQTPELECPVHLETLVLQK